MSGAAAQLMMPRPPIAAPQRGQPNMLPPDRTAGAGQTGYDPAFGADIGEYVALPDDPDDLLLQDAPDGGAFVDLPGERDESRPPDDEFYANLAAVLPGPVKQRIATDLLGRVEEDKQAREERDKQYEEGIKRTGLGKDAPGGAQFEGASKVVHPMMTEACVDYASRVMRETFPPSGPVKPRVIGTVTAEKTERAQRKTEHMNWQCTSQIKEFRSVLETTYTQVPLGGSQFIRLWQDHRLKRVRCEFVPIDRIYLPAGAQDFASAHRKTYADTISAVEFRQRVDQGMYLDLDLSAPSEPHEPSKAEKASYRVEGVDPPASNQDGDRLVYEIQCYLEVTDDAAEVLGLEQAGELYPYLITIDSSSKQMLAMYRDWEDGDDAREPIEHLFEFGFLPWRGAFSIGFPQIIGGLSAAATGALRALLDSAHINNAAGGFILKGSGASGQTRQPNPGEFIEIDGGLEADDIRKRLLPNNIQQPSPVLFQLLGFVTEGARGVVRTSLDEAPAQGGAPVPVGTQMSRVEEGLVVFSAVHARAHAALDRLLAGLHRLNRLYMPEVLKVDGAGKEIMVRRRDYEGPCDIQPVSDPVIYSDLQRFNQLNYIQQRMLAVPGMYDARAVELAGLRLMKWPDPETILLAQAAPEEANAVTENVNMAMGKGALVLPEQDHLAHLQVHLDFMQSPALGGSPLIAPAFLPAALKHCSEHILQFYAAHAMGTIEQAARRKVGDLLSNDAHVKTMFDRLLATASRLVTMQVTQAFAGAMPVLQQAMAMAQQFAPKPPMDPAAAAVQAAMAETQRKSAADQAGNQVAQGKIALQQQANNIQIAKVAAMRENAQLAAQTKMQTTAADNQTAEEIAQMRGMGGAAPGFTDGESLTQ